MAEESTLKALFFFAPAFSNVVRLFALVFNDLHVFEALHALGIVLALTTLVSFVSDLLFGLIADAGGLTAPFTFASCVASALSMVYISLAAFNMCSCALGKGAGGAS